MKLSITLGTALLAACGPDPAPSPAPVAKRWAGDIPWSDPALVARLDALAPPAAPPPARHRAHARGDCQPAYAPRPARDPSPMCKVTGGTFMMGGPIELPHEEVFSRQPVPVKTPVPTFFIDQFEVSFGQMALFLNAHGNACGGSDPRCVHVDEADARPPGVGDSDPSPAIVFRDGRYRVEPPEAADLGVAFVNAQGAVRYCAWAGKRVATSAEWEYAARHDPVTGDDYQYVWGNELGPARESRCPRGERCSIFDRPAAARGQSPSRDDPSPWGVFDMAAWRAELLFDCGSETDDCSEHTCQCPMFTTVPYFPDPAGMTTYARRRSTVGAVRCVRSR